ncbi:MAG: SDR family oxidoreductase [Methylomonas sp.]
MSENFKRIAIVTGATSGIGEATVRKFAAEGYGVIGTGRNADKLGQLARELPGAFFGVPGDMSAPGLIDDLFATAEQYFAQPADIVVANAGRGLGGSVKDADLDAFREIIELNVTATLALLQKAARLMSALQPAKYPHYGADIVIVGSVVGRHISPFSAVYGCTKFAVHSLAEGLRRELAPQGVRVSLVEPGLVLSGFQSEAGYSDELVQSFKDRFGPLLVGEDIANAIHFMVSQPPHVHISDIMVRPTRQDYP